MDIVDTGTRSRMMGSIRGHDTVPELTVRRYLHAAGLRFRTHDRTLPGRPDIVLSKHRAAIFVHGCFWHRHPGCRYATTPRTRGEFWLRKFEGNVARDGRDLSLLAAAGWRAFVVWECELGNVEVLDLLYWQIVLGA